MKIVIAVTGSIAAYKIAELTSKLIKNNHQVTIVMSQSALKFISSLTLQVLSKNKVYTDLFEESENKIIHIDLLKENDLLLVAPATANIISKVSYGLADDLISSMILANKDKPIIFAPAMNTNMYLNKNTQKNMKYLTKLGYHFIKPKTGVLACLETGIGALESLDLIIERVVSIHEQNSLKNR
ncbi:MAG: flavoprotein [Bacilli bacterium]